MRHPLFCVLSSRALPKRTSHTLWLQGYAPAGMQFQDVEEEYVVDAASGRGRWQPVSRQAVAAERQAQREEQQRTLMQLAE